MSKFQKMKISWPPELLLPFLRRTWLRGNGIVIVDNKTANVRRTWHWEAFLQPFLHYKSNKYYIFLVCVCSLIYPAYSAHAPYCHLWPVRLYNIFSHYYINDTIFKKKLLNMKCVFWFSLQLLSETFLNIRRTERDMIGTVYWSLCKVPDILVRF
jgi:hypothetical protein